MNIVFTGCITAFLFICIYAQKYTCTGFRKPYKTGMSLNTRTSMAELSNDQMKRSQNASAADGALAATMTGMGENFVQAFAIKLGASAPIAVLAVAFPQFVAAVMQLLAVPLSNAIKSRRPWVAFGATAQRLLLVPLALLAWWASPYALWALIAIYCAYLTIGALVNPIWSSWMAEIVPESMRGEYFSKRGKIVLVATVISAFAGGWLYREYAAAYSAGAEHIVFSHFYGAGELGGFALLFGIAFAAGMASVAYLLKMDDVEYGAGGSQKLGLFDLFTNPAQKESRTFAQYIFILMAGTYISSPFFAVYMLSGLKFDLLTFSLVAIAASMGKYATLPYWGHLSDRFGPRAVFITCGILIPFVPIPWIFVKEPWMLMAAEVFSGVAWGGFELSCFNFVLGRQEKTQRTAAVAVYNMSKGAGLFVGSAIGIALWIFVLPKYAWLGNAYALLFGISVAARLFASAAFLPQFGEESFGGMRMGKFLWQTLAINPTIGAGRRLSGSFQIGSHLFHSSVEYSGHAAKGGLDLVIYALKRGPIMVEKKLKGKKGL